MGNISVKLLDANRNIVFERYSTELSIDILMYKVEQIINHADNLNIMFAVIIDEIDETVYYYNNTNKWNYLDFELYDSLETWEFDSLLDTNIIEW